MSEEEKDTTIRDNATSDTPIEETQETTTDTSSTSSSSSEVEDLEDSPTSPSNDPTETLLKAATHKEEGNAHFKSGQLSKAAKSYRTGANLLKKLNRGNTGDEQVKSLLITLQTNMSMVCLKQNKPRQSRDLASAALDVDGTHCKALFRRAVAHRQLGDMDQAKADLKRALQHHPDNRDVKRELLAIKKAEKEKTEKEKRALKGMFSKGSSLYEDKAAEEKKKQQEKEKKKKEDEEAKKKRKLEWEKEKEQKEKDGEEFVSFEEWDKKRRKAEEDERKRKKKQEDKRRKEEQERKRQERKSRGKKDDSDSDDDDILSEKEMALLRGYKKTTDGRTTSYFHRELSDGEKALIGDITPQRLDTSTHSPSASFSAAAAVPDESSSSTTAVSAWNTAQTWEEKNTTDWCASCLQRNLEKTCASTALFKAHFHTVDVKGDASFATSSGRKRYIFDYTATCQFSIYIPITAEVEDEGPPSDEEDVLAKGKLTLPDVSSTVEEHLYEVTLRWTKEAKGAWEEKILAFGESELIDAVRASVKSFVQDFNNEF